MMHIFWVDNCTHFLLNEFFYWKRKLNFHAKIETFPSILQPLLNEIKNEINGV